MFSILIFWNIFWWISDLWFLPRLYWISFIFACNFSHKNIMTLFLNVICCDKSPWLIFFRFLFFFLNEIGAF